MANAWYGVEVTKEIAPKLKEFLRQEHSVLDFEPSECWDRIHIEIKAEISYEELSDKFMAWLKKEVA